MRDLHIFGILLLGVVTWLSLRRRDPRYPITEAGERAAIAMTELRFSQESRAKFETLKAAVLEKYPLPSVERLRTLDCAERVKVVLWLMLFELNVDLTAPFEKLLEQLISYVSGETRATVYMVKDWPKMELRNRMLEVMFQLEAVPASRA